MGKTIQIRVDESLQQILERIRKEVAEDMKRTYGLSKVTVYGTLSSQILAAKMAGQRTLTFKINKTKMNEGVLELL